MNQTVTIQLLNDRALLLLQELERMQILRVLPPATAPRRWSGALDAATARNMLQSLEQSREEWERNI